MITRIKETVEKVEVGKLSMQELYYYYLLLIELGLIFKEETDCILNEEDYME